MLYSKLKAVIQEFYGAALFLEKMFPLERRHIYQKNLAYACIFLFVLVVTSYGMNTVFSNSFSKFTAFSDIGNRLYGVFLITISVTFVFACFEALHRSYYFKGLKQVLGESTDPDHIPVSWEVATIVDESRDGDITGSFINSSYGQEILYRLGITPDIFSKYDMLRIVSLHAEGFIIERDKGVTLATYARSVYKHDETFRQFLSENNINEEHLVRAAEWVASIEQKESRKKRWWSRDNLGRLQGLGKTWSYGQTYYLERFGHEITQDHIWQTALMTRREEDDEVEDLEQVLSRGRQSNALLLTNDVLTARQRVAQLYYKIREGRALPPIEAKRIFILDIESVVMNNSDKAKFERMITEICNQAVDAGNIIIYIENFATACTSTVALGVDITDLLSPYFESRYIQIIIGETHESYNKQLSRDSRIGKAFDVILMKDVGQEGLFDLLEQRAFMLEKRTNVVFSIQSLETIGELADRYFPTGVMPDKAFDLLEELIPYAFLHNLIQVLQKDVEAFVNKKTNVPIGEPKKEEREKLLELERFLHKRVVAQEEAISAISKALRRARAGLANPNKPLGTFLFLGPTGVGKTETAKALSEIMFDDENAMIRLDMSEFNSESALDELLGSFEKGTPGRLEELLRKKQYGILLLDEFEKSHKVIHDLFLQILDEGHFTDSFGHGVNLKNHIIIATSNAGAELIWEWENNKSDVIISDYKQNLIDHLIEKNIFRPELLNRFDDIILFHTLSTIQVSRIARIHLEKFAKRMETEQKIKVRITENLVSYVAKKGYDVKFGGRPLERAILTIVEQKIADQILAGKLHQGDTFEFTDEVLAE